MKADPIAHVKMDVPFFLPSGAGPAQVDQTYTEFVNVMGPTLKPAVPSGFFFWDAQCAASSSFPAPNCSLGSAFLLWIGTGNGDVPLQAGQTYRNTKESQVSDTGTLNWGFQSFGFDFVTGSFTLKDFTYHFNSLGDSLVDSIDVDFSLYGDYGTTPITGEYMYSANGSFRSDPSAVPPSDVPEPKPTALVVAGIGAFVARKMCARPPASLL